MALTHSIVQRQSQTLVMTQRLSQSIKLLAMSNVELDAFVADALERNPLLARAQPDAPALAPAATPGETVAETVAGRLDTDIANIEPDARHHLPRGPAVPITDLADVWERADCAPQGLTQHLEAQIALSGHSPLITALARAIAHDLDDGYLREPDALRARLAVSERDFAKAWTLVRSLEPAGIGARDLTDCLGLQLAARDRLDPAMRRILDNIDLVAKRDLSGLSRVSGLDVGDVLDALRELRTLDPRPAARFEAPPPAAVPPDVLLAPAQSGGWAIELNPDTLPRLLIDRDYRTTVVPRKGDAEARRFLADAMDEANWLTRAMDQRARTIVATCAEIARRQDGFLTFGVAHLKPMTLMDVAEAIGVHESTVSRVASAKTMATPRGVFALKSFFTRALPATDGGEAHSAAAVRARIRALVEAETRPLSDEAIVAILRDEGVALARRTVAKYRDALGIPSSAVRRRTQGMPEMA